MGFDFFNSNSLCLVKALELKIMKLLDAVMQPNQVIFKIVGNLTTP